MTETPSENNWFGFGIEANDSFNVISDGVDVKSIAVSMSDYSAAVQIDSNGHIKIIGSSGQPTLAMNPDGSLHGGTGAAPPDWHIKRNDSWGGGLVFVDDTGNGLVVGDPDANTFSLLYDGAMVSRNGDLQTQVRPGRIYTLDISKGTESIFEVGTEGSLLFGPGDAPPDISGARYNDGTPALVFGSPTSVAAPTTHDALWIYADGSIYSMRNDGDTYSTLSPAGGVELKGGGLVAAEIADPASPAANQGVLYFKDVGGKTALVARFPTGAVQQVAIEP